MWKYVVKRILYMIFVFFLMSFVLFFLYNKIPGDPARSQLEPLKATLEPQEYQYRYEKLREEMGLDDPIYIRYGKWMGGILTGEFGESFIYRRPVLDVVKTPLKNTIFINIFAIILALGITIPLGIKTAVKRNSTFDKVVQD